MIEIPNNTVYKTDTTDSAIHIPNVMFGNSSSVNKNKGEIMKKISAKAHVTIEVNIRADDEEGYQNAIRDIWNHGVNAINSKGYHYSWIKRSIISVENKMKITNTTKESKTDER